MRWVVRGFEGGREIDVEATGEGLQVTIDGRTRTVELFRLDGTVASLRFADNGASHELEFVREARRRWRVAVDGHEFSFEVLPPVEAAQLGAHAAAEGPARIEAPIPGKVVAVRVAVGDAVVTGQPLVVLEAMKMENELTSQRDGTVTGVFVEEGVTVEAGSPLVEIE
ncbi:MAG: biotin/lipoyl-binding protein [Acidobacteria bacterium]|jgi:biotin carboxyl carrier protein|nr:biotin/lipoyl-binding protein [Acidobacteriota bacterium]